MWLCGVVVGDLIDKGPVGSHVRDVFWNWEVLNGFYVLWQRFNPVLSDSYTCPINYIFPEVKFFRIKNDAVVTCQFQILGHLIEGVLQGLGIEESIINHPLNIVHVLRDLIVSMGVSVSAC